MLSYLFILKQSLDFRGLTSNELRQSLILKFIFHIYRLPVGRGTGGTIYRINMGDRSQSQDVSESVGQQA
jgi:hypothetical protein